MREILTIIITLIASLAHAQWQYINPSTLPDGNGTSLLQTSVIGRTGGNNFYSNIWLYGTAAANDWTTTKLIDGISIDVSYQTPLTSRSWWMRDPVNGSHSWGDGSSTFLTLRNNGNLGMGTSSPSIWFGTKTFEFSDYRPVLKLTSTSPAGLSSIVFTNSSVNSNTHIGEFHVNYQFNQTNNEKSLLRFGSYPASEILAMQANGNVGIGTTNPDAKLAVKGTIHAEEVKVDLNIPGPDYVFESTYQLPSLTEIESYIKANKHLPEVPSAKEMETNGINLSEMNMLLLKKVEELTLYVIELKKENEKQNEVITTLLKK